MEINDASFREIKRMGELSSSGVFVFHVEKTRFLFINTAIVRILEFEKSLLIDEPEIVLHSIPPHDIDYLKLRFAELLSDGSVEDVQIRIIQNNVEKVLLCNAYLSRDNTAIIGFVKDVTNAKKHEEYLSNFGARKDAILDMVAQNLSTPLNLSKFTVDLIEKALKEKKYHKLNAHVRLMREVTAESIKVIDKFLQEEHLESPNVNVESKRFDIIAKIFIVVEKLKESHPDKQFKFKSEEKHLFIEADDLKFFQVIHNLLSNAIKFTGPNGLIEITIKEPKGKVQIIIKDDGIGIPDDLKPYVFEKHSSAGRPGLRGEISNGIGLFVVKRLTEMMNGRISFESKVDKGTKFTLELPRR